MINWTNIQNIKTQKCNNKKNNQIYFKMGRFKHFTKERFKWQTDT